MKILFLDIDGVFGGIEKVCFDAECVKRINTVLRETGAKPVITSSLRHMVVGPKATCDIHSFEQMLARWGFGSHLYGLTPSDTLIKGRENQVRYWLSKNRKDIDSWAVIDDSFLDFETDGYRFVWTDGDIGIQDIDVKLLKSILNR